MLTETEHETKKHAIDKGKLLDLLPLDVIDIIPTMLGGISHKEKLITDMNRLNINSNPVLWTETQKSWFLSDFFVPCRPMVL